MANPAVDIRVLSAAFPPTTTEFRPEQTPAKSSFSVLLPASVLGDLRDSQYITKLRESARVKLDTASLSGKTVASSSGSSTLADVLRSDSQKGVLYTDADNRTWTTNGAGAYSGTGDAVLDAFFSLGQWSDGKEVQARLADAWAQDPEKTLKLIFNLRSIHEGKNSRNIFFHAFGWLYREHPVTAIWNLDQLVAKVCEDPRNVPARKKWEQAMLQKQLDPEDMEFVERPARSHGCWKDLLSLVSLAFNDQLGDPKMDPESLKTVFGPVPTHPPNHAKCDHPMPVPRENLKEYNKLSTALRRARDEEYAQLHRQMMAQHLEEWKTKARERRHEQQEERISTLERKLNEDPKFRSLYVAVARLYGDALVHDIKTLVEIVNLRKSSGDKHEIARQERRLSNTISLAAKWAPSHGKTFDRQFLMTSAIAQVLFPFNGPSDSPDRTEQMLKARSMLRRFVLTPLREYIAIPEANMHPGKWDKLAYSRVPAVAFSSNKSLFWHHDQHRFIQHLEAIGKGKKTVSGSSLLPHEILIAALDSGGPLDLGGSAYRPASRAKLGKMVKAKYERQMKASLGKLYSGIYESQWASMREHIAALGALENCIAICDVSGSMGSTSSARAYIKDGQVVKRPWVQPIFPALALSILVAQLAQAPWKNMFITFSSKPELVELLLKSADGSEASLGEVVDAMVRTHWEMNTDFVAVFRDLILKTAKRHKLSKEQMVKRVFVFSDMQFDAAQSGGGDEEWDEEWETAHDVIEGEFRRAGYDMPELVYWNLAGGRYGEGMGMAAPVDKDVKGVSLMSGFSGSMLKAFVGEEVADDEEQGEKEKEQEKEWDDADVELQQVEKPKKEKMQPADKMNKVLGAKSYAGLKVYD